MFKKLHIKLKYYNFRLIILVLALTSLGIVLIGSAVPGGGYQSKQMIGLAGSIVIMLVVSVIDYQWILKLHWLAYAMCVLLLVLVLLIGNEVNGATRWIEIGGGLSIQPSEFAKIFMIVFWAWLFGKHPHFLDKWKNFLVVSLLTGVPIFLILKEPNLSTTLLMIGLFTVSLYFGGFSYKKFGILLLIFVPLLAAAFIYVQTPNQKLLHGYQLNRILSFINPDEYDDLRYQQDNSVLAIGSGQLNGKGLYNDSSDSVKNGNYIVEPQTDFIFAIAGEEMGFIGSCIILGLMVFITLECIITGVRAPDLAGRIICFAIATIITLQTFINIGVATELLPNTGIPLPFVSYGLSSLVTMYAAMGLVLNVRIKKKASMEEGTYEHRFNRT